MTLDRLGSPVIRVDIARQELSVAEHGRARKRYRVSTSKFGTGCVRDSFRTPLGRHIVRAKIGGGQPLGAVFVGRRPTGEVYSADLARAYPDRDWILTRILWLSGLEVGKNRLGDVDTMRRYIYIHGTPDSDVLGTPTSIGCVRMSNVAILELYDMIPVGTIVLIE